MLGAYFVPAEKPKAKATTEREAYLSPSLSLPSPSSDFCLSATPDAGSTGEGLSNHSTLVGTRSSSSSSKKLPKMRNPWGGASDDGRSDAERDSGWNSSGSDLGTSAPPSPSEAFAPSPLDGQAAEHTRTNAASPAGDALRRDGKTPAERRAKHKASLEKRTIAVSVLSRMLVVPLVLCPVFAYYCVKTRYNV